MGIHGRQDATVEVGQCYELAALCGIDVLGEREAVVVSICEEVDHNNYHVENDIVQPMRQMFPHEADDVQEPLLLLNVETWVNRHASWLAPDVAARVPYIVDWTPIDTERSRTAKKKKKSTL